MKKYLFFASMLLSVVMLLSCNNSDDEGFDNGSESDGSTISPINVSEGPIADFFNVEWPNKTDRAYNAKSFFYDSSRDFGLQVTESVVSLINSRQELADIYLGDKELPDIDFDKYTLIIGRQKMPYPYFYVAKQELIAGKDGLILNLYANNDEEILPCMKHCMYFWGLYPKLSQKAIIVNVSENYRFFPQYND